MIAVEVVGLVKYYGEFQAIRNVTFDVMEGEIFGLIGPNGAGKTTTLRIIATLLKPSRGTVRVFGIDVVEKPEEVRKLIGYLPEEAGLYERLTGYENLKVFAKLYTDSDEDASKMVKLGLSLADLGERVYDRVSTYSKGMKRRLAMARALMVKPRLAILDEPTAGLDVDASVRVRKSIKEFVMETRCTVILSSHNMLEVEYLCDRVAFISGGKIIAIGTPEQLKEKYQGENLEEAFVKAVRGGRI